MSEIRKQMIFDAKLNMTEFHRAVDEIQKKMRQINAGASPAASYVSAKEKMGTMPGLGVQGATAADRARAEQQDKEFQNRARAFAKEQLDIAARANKLWDEKHAKVLKINEEIQKGLKNEKEAQEELKKLQGEKLKAAEIAARYSKSAETITGGLPSGGGGGGGGAGAKPQQAAKIDNLLTGVGIVGAAAGISKVLEVASAASANQRAVSTAQGNAMQGVIGNTITNMFSQDNMENILFRAQKTRAVKNAEAEEKRDREIDQYKMTAAIATTVIGVATGGVGFLAAGAAGSAVAFSPTLRNMFLGNKAEYESLSAQRQAEKEAEQYQAELNKDPTFTTSMRTFQQQASQNLAFKRSLGLSDRDYFDLISSNADLARGGFTREQTMSAGAGILGAGGSTQAAKQLAGFSNSIAKYWNVTNSNQLVGQLSGAMGATETPQAIIKMLGEGFDASKFAQENRKFLEASTQLIYNSNITSGAGAQYVSATLRAGIGTDEPTMRRIQSAQNAYQAYQQATGESGGWSGALKQVEFNKAGFGRLGVGIQTNLAELKEEDVAEGAQNRTIRQLAKQTQKKGESFDDAVKRVQLDVIKGQRSRFFAMMGGDAGKLIKKFQTLDPSSQEYEAVQEELTGLITASEGKMPKEQLDSYLNMIATKPEDIISRKVKALKAPSEQKAEDVAYQGKASEDRAVAEEMRMQTKNIVDSISKSSIAINTYTETFINATKRLSAALASNDEEEIKNARKNMQRVSGQSPFSSPTLDESQPKASQ